MLKNGCQFNMSANVESSGGIEYGQPFAVDHIIIPVYLYASWQAVESILHTGQMKATLPERCNDLCDMLPPWSNERQGERCLRNAREHNYKAMFCFSLTPNSAVMWGHYAERGKGAVLKFDLPVFLKRDEQPHLEESYMGTGQVIMRIGECVYPYRSGRMVGVKNLYLQKVCYSARRRQFCSPIESYSGYLQFLSTKGKEWEYEKEVRILMDRQNSLFCVRDGNYYSSELMKYFSGISLGPIAEVRRDDVQKLLASASVVKSASWAPIEEEAIMQAEISSTHFSINSGWEETSEEVFEQIPEIHTFRLINCFPALKD